MADFGRAPLTRGPVMQKLDASNRAEAIQVAEERGWL
jgi:hypothetical protein